MSSKPTKVELAGRAMSSSFGFASGLTIWMASNFAPDWFADALHEAHNGTDHNARRREILFAVCCAESYIVEWVRDEVLNRDFERLDLFFPPGRKRGVTAKWEEVPKELAKAKLIPAKPDHSGKCWGDWLKLVDLRDGLVHARSSRPKKKAGTEETFTPKADLDRLAAGWAVRVVVELVCNLHAAAGKPPPAWIKEP